jgi:hypothetical protein
MKIEYLNMLMLSMSTLKIQYKFKMDTIYLQKHMVLQVISKKSLSNNIYILMVLIGKKIKKCELIDQA